MRITPSSVASAHAFCNIYKRLFSFSPSAKSNLLSGDWVHAEDCWLKFPLELLGYRNLDELATKAAPVLVPELLLLGEERGEKQLKKLSKHYKKVMLFSGSRCLSFFLGVCRRFDDSA